MKRYSLASLLLVSFLTNALNYAYGLEEWPDGPNPPAHAYDDVHRFIFSSVLEGCYADGVTNEELEFIIPTAANGKRKMTVNFVIQCPLCNPAYDAFTLYAGRPHMSQPAKSTNYTTFGPGLADSVKEKLAKPGLSCRDAIQGLIEKWVNDRIATLRLNEEETAQLREELAERRKKGEEWLTGFQKGNNGDILRETYKDWKKCPVCSGSSPMGGTKD